MRFVLGIGAKDSVYAISEITLLRTLPLMRAARGNSTVWCFGAFERAARWVRWL